MRRDSESPEIMTNDTIDILVLRKGTEGLPMTDYVEQLENRLPEYQIDHAQTPTEEKELIRKARVATGTSIDGSLLAEAKNLELFVVASSGTGHLPLDKLKHEGIALANASGIHAPGIAEQAIGYCLAHARRLHEGWNRKQSSQWRHYQAYEFSDSVVTIVGLGSIGHAIAKRLDGFDVETIGIRYTPEKDGPTDKVYGFCSDDLHEALARTDYLILSTPLSDTTRHLIGSEELATLDPSAVLVNVSRGAVVDTDALLKALQTGQIRGAALDVTDPEPLPSSHPLWKMDNVFVTPHMGGHTPRHWERLAEITATNIKIIDNNSSQNLQNEVLPPARRVSEQTTNE